jgi:glycerophosphoryl diester phosphodiesterase
MNPARLLPLSHALKVVSGRVKPHRPGLSSLAEQVKIIAHRGASHLAPENTLASIRLAWELGADAVEVDVHLTKDGRIVAIHDATTGRTCGTYLEIADTFSWHLRRLDVGRHKHRDFTGETIPFMEEVLDTLPAGRQLFIEVKCGPEVLAPLEKAVTRADRRSQIVLIGFDFAAMRAARQAMPDVPVYWLRDKPLWRYRPALAARAREAGFDGLDVYWSGLSDRFVAAVKRAGLKLYVWTVDDPAVATRLQAMGVDGITTNRPDRFRSRSTLPPPGTQP